MHVRATILKHSFLHKDWRGRSRVRGELHGILFGLTVNGEYVANNIPPDKLHKLLASNFVQIELMGLMPVVESSAVEEVAALIATENEEPTEALTTENGEPIEVTSELVAVDDTETIKRKPGRPTKKQ